VAAVADVWSQGEAYERFMGRWSRLLAPQFLHWLRAPAGLRWADVGCGSGALSSAILDLCSPDRLTALDPSEAQVAEASGRIHDPRVSFGVGTAGNLPARSFDAVVSGLVLNFVPEPDAAVSAMARAAPGGIVAAYVWDYAEGMQLLRTFWDVACELDPDAAGLHEGRRFSFATAEALAELWTGAGLSDVQTTAVLTPTVFEDFADFWSPFLGGQGPAPGYVASLGEDAREALRSTLESRLQTGKDGTIALMARAWAVRGRA
jgi:SAM-dependent methyltransferase